MGDYPKKATQPKDFRELTEHLATGDDIELNSEIWRVISVEDNVVEVRPIEDMSKDIKYIRPSSGYLNSAASTRGSGFSEHYQTVRIVRKS